MSAEKDVIKYCNVYFEGLKEKEFECDIVVPDSEPDICQVIMAEQQNTLSDVLLANGKITVRGKSIVNALCRPEQGEQAVFMAHSFDFEQVFDTDNVPNDAKVSVFLEKGYVSCKILNSRKLGIRAMTRIKVCAVGNEEAEIFTGGEGVEVLTSECEYSSLIGCDERTVKVSEDTELEPAFPAIEKLLFTTAHAYCADRKIINNRIIVKGILETKTYYLAVDGTYRASSAEIPFNHIFNIDGVDENSVCVVIMNVKNIEAEVYNNADAENRVIAIEAELYCTALAYAEKKVLLCEDAYSTLCECKVQKNSLNLYGKPYESIGNAEFKERVKFDGAISTVSAISGEAVIGKIESKGGVLAVYGDILLSVLAVTEDGALQCAESKIPFEIKTDACSCNCKCMQANAVVCNLKYTAVTADTLEISGNIKVDLQYCPCISSESVCALNETGAVKASLCDMLIYYPDANERYWDIAKRYAVSASSIKSVNSCDGDICTESMLIIPKL